MVRTPAPCLRREDGAREIVSETWLLPATSADEHALRRATPPVLDIGCGPGRHVLALAELGVPALGIDITPVALRTARARGALVLERSVFDRVPGGDRWGSALLLDGNVGIGGDPVSLVRRVLELLRPSGVIIVELAPPSAPAPVRTVRLELDGRAGPWFRWARVTVDDADLLARSSGARLEEQWSSDGRWFACLGVAG
jgi:SAM-dependent methyltransferase